MTWKLIPLPHKVIAPVMVGLALFIGATGMTRLASSLAEGPLTSLDAARQKRAALAAIAERPVRPAKPLLADGLAQSTADRAAALEAMTRTIRTIAARAGVLVERHEPSPADEFPKPLVAIHLTASGSEKALLTFINDIERARPAMRFATWKLARADEYDPALRLDARVMSIMADPH